MQTIKLQPLGPLALAYAKSSNSYAGSQTMALTEIKVTQSTITVVSRE